MAKPKKPSTRVRKVTLSERQRQYVQGRLDGLSGTESARRAGYGSPEQASCQLLKMPRITDAIAKGQAILNRPSIANRQERLEILTAIVRESGKRDTDRISASKLISQMSGELIQKHEVAGPDGGPVQLQALTALSTPELAKLAGVTPVLPEPKESNEVEPVETT